MEKLRINMFTTMKMKNTYLFFGSVSFNLIIHAAEFGGHKAPEYHKDQQAPHHKHIGKHDQWPNIRFKVTNNTLK